MHLRPICLSLAVFMAPAALAQAQDAPSESAALNALLACQSIADDTQRLICQDEQLAAFAQATQSGQVVVVERRAVQAVARESFGLDLPSVGRLTTMLRGGSNRQVERAAADQTTQFEDGSSATYNSDGQIEQISGLKVAQVTERQGKLWVTLENGQVWRQTDSTVLGHISARRIRNGVTADVELGALGSHFMRLSSHSSRRFRAERVR